MPDHFSRLSPDDTTFVALLRRRAEQQPDQLAYTFLLDGETELLQLTYAELDRRARMIAARLQGLRGYGERALLLYPPGLDYIAAFFGCLYAGVVAVPAYPPNPARLERTLPRLWAIVHDARPILALTTTPILSMVETVLHEHPDVAALRWLATDMIGGDLAEAWSEPVVSRDTLAFLQYTSGSTAEPKGVMLTHGNLLHNSALIRRAFAHTPASRGVIWLPPYHDMGLIGGILQPLYAGFPVTLMSPIDFLQRPFRWLHAIWRYRATTSGGPNFAYDLCVRKIAPEQRAALDLRSWRVAFNGAEPIRPDTLDRFAEAFAPCGFRREAFNSCYGLAEATLIVSGADQAAAPVVRAFQPAALEHNQAIESGPDVPGACSLVGCGWALADQQVLIVQPESRTRCGPGCVGEVWVAGPSVAQGYWGRPDETAQAFHATLADGAAGTFLRTGDLGFVQDGELFITGRLKDLIIIRGRNYYPQDIELAAERSHPALRPGCGAAFSVEVAGEERLVIVQEVERRYQDLDVGAVAAQIRQAVAEQHELQVHAVALLPAGRIPKTSSGKIQRHACRADFLAGRLAIVGDSFLPEEAEAASAGPALTRAALLAAAPEQRPAIMEAYLRDRAARALGVAPPRVDPRQPLIGLGLDSLMTIELQHAVESDLGIALSMERVLDGASTSELAASVLAALEAPSAASPAPLAHARQAAATSPLSYGQRALWFMHQLAPHSSAYTIANAVRIAAPLDIPALQRAFQTLVDRHAALRTTFTSAHGAPTQRIHPQVPAFFQHADAGAWSEAALRERLNEAAWQPFDLERGPLLRIHLFTKSPHEHILVLAIHHIATDFWSLTVLARELGLLYAAERANLPIHLAPLALEYIDYVRWQLDMLTGPEGERLWSYWRRTLSGELPVLALPADRPRAADQINRGAAHTFALDPAYVQGLRTLSESHGATRYTTLLAAFALLLFRYTGQTDILIGFPTAGRASAQLAGLVGYFVNPVVLRADLSGNPAFAALLERTRRTLLEALAHQEYPFALLAERLQPVRDPGRSPLVQVMFVLQKTPSGDEQDLAVFALGAAGARMELAGLHLTSVALEQPTAQFDLTFTLAETRGGLTASLHYNADRFDAVTMMRMAGHFQAALRCVNDNPGRQMADVPLLADAEQQQLLIEWNSLGNRGQGTGDRTIQELFAEQAARAPDAVAVVFAGAMMNDEGRTTKDERSDSSFVLRRSSIVQLTYRELNRRANQLAHELRSRGVGPDTLVGVCLERSIELVIALLAVLKAGGAYLPLDPSYPSERISFMLEDSQARVLVTNDQRPTTNDRITHPVTLSPCHLVYLDTDWPMIARQPETNPDSDATPENLAYVIYTSGSTGTPKGVVVPHANAVRLFAVTRQWFEFGQRDIWTLFHSAAFDFSVWELWGALANGSRLVVVPYEVSRAPGVFYELVWAQRVSVLNQTPSAFYQFIAADAAAPQAARLALRLVIFGGEALNVASLGPWWQRHDERRPRLVNMYGITETTVHVTYRALRQAGVQQGDASAIGRPLPDLQVYVLDSRRRAALIGVAGELYVGGAGLARGYLNRPDLTAERFIPNPFAEVSGIGYWVSGARLSDTRYPTPDTRLYKTGDLARFLPDGQLEYLGRIDQQIKLRGFRIELGEIEAVLGRHPAVREAAVLLREDEPPAGGYPDRRLVAYIVEGSGVRGQESDNLEAETLTPDPRPLIPDLRDFLRQRLPDYMLPAAFVFLDALPLTPNGKLDRRALPAPAARRPDLDGSYTAPRTPVEELLAQLWAAVLKLERVGVYDNFFALGGHSLLATQLISRIRETFAVELPLRSLFEAPTVAGLSERITGIQRGEDEPRSPPICPIPRERALPLSYAQQRLWFLNQLQPDSPAYNVPMAVRLTGPIELHALVESLNTIMSRHESLRTTFVIAAGQPAQAIARLLKIPLRLGDLQALAEPARTTALHRLIGPVAAHPFDLTRGPLIRVALARLAAHEHVLLVTMHHIVSDGWSIGVFVRELAALYGARVLGTTAALPELPIQYADYAVWQRQWLKGELLSDQLGYWRRQLADLPVVQLPTDHPRPMIATFRGATQTFTLTHALTEALDALARDAGVTVFMALLATWHVLLARYSGQRDIVVGTTIANRTRSEVEPLIGCFMNTLVLRADLSGSPSFHELLGRVREVCLDAYAHQDVPFEQLVEALQPTRDLSRQPLFQILFELQNAPIGSLDLPGLETQPLAVEQGGAKFDLGLVLTEAADTLTGTLWYTTDLFDATTIARMAGHFQVLLAGAIADPARRIAELPLLTDAERQELIVSRNTTRSAYPAELCFHQLFEAQVARTSDATAVVFDGRRTNDEGRRTNDERGRGEACLASTRHLTYAELDRRANQLAQHLRALGVGPGARVGICMERSLDMIVGLLGIFKAGAAFVPLDLAYPAERMSFMLEDSGVAAVLVASNESSDKETSRQSDKGTDVASDVTLSPLRLVTWSAQTVDLCRDWEAIARQPAQSPDSGVTGAHLAYLIYTSGSTGWPKGVLISHRGLVNYLVWCLDAYTVAQGRGAPVHASIAADAIFPSLFAPLLAGTSVVIMPEAQALDALGTELCGVGAFSMIKITPSQLDMLNHQLPPVDARGWVRTLVVGAEALRGEVLRFWQARAPDTVLLNEYGPTETVVGCSIYEVAAPITGAVPIGLPIANTQFYVLDAQLQPVPIGVPGELYIGGDGVAWGYLNRPELTAERFIPNPFAGVLGIGSQVSEDTAPNTQHPIPDTRLYKTGDLVRYLPDREANIEFLGRIDDQVKIRGYRVEPGEVETVLRSHARVRECVVLARADGPDRKRLVAYVVPNDDEQRTTNDEGSDSSFVVGRSSPAPELWPSIGEYLLYDELIYHVLTNDEPRQRVYRSALDLTVRGRVVVDIGTGADAILARMCVEAGAKKVYAVEVLHEAYESARRQVERLDMQDKITLIRGDSTQIALPEPVDVCVSQIIGVIGGAEGAVAIINDARRFLKADGLVIPQRSVTKIAAVCLPDEIAQHPHFSTVPRYYAEKTFEKVGHRFDLRLCIKNFPLSNLISDVGVFEDLDFTIHGQPEYRREIQLTINKRARLDGFLVWLNLHVTPEEQLDVLEGAYAWLPVYFPVFYPGVDVAESDTITAICSATLSDNRINPDYAIAGALRTAAGTITFAYQSAYDRNHYKATPFYRALFEAEAAPSRADDRARGLVESLREHLKRRVPEYMLPSAFVVIDALPLAPHGKIDRRALPEPDGARPELLEGYAQPQTTIEEQLAGIWAQVLRIDRVGVHDNFFSLGGDSILGIQVIDRVSQLGLRLTPRQIFQHQTIAELSAVLEPLQTIQAEQGLVAGPVPLAPIQRWFFEQDFAEPQHYNQALLLEARRPLDPALVKQAIGRLLLHHDALRLRFQPAETGWLQSNASSSEAPFFTSVDLAALPEHMHAAAIMIAASAAQASLNLAGGPILRAVCFDCGPAQPARLLLVIHHLAVDAVSWRVLLADLQAAYEQLDQGKPVILPAKTTAFRRWAERLAAYAQSEALREEQRYWLGRPWHRVRPLPRDFPADGNRVASARTLSVSLSAEETQALLHEIPETYRAQINDVLLTALALAFARWAAVSTLLVDLEGHGREDLFADVDVSRTVGWFTTIFPLVLDLEWADQPGEALRAVKQQLGAVPQRGLGYGILRYLEGSEEIAQTLRALPAAEVSFNYLGQIDQAVEASWLFRPAQEPSGPAQSPRAHRPYRLEIRGMIVGGRLQMDWIYSAQIHRQATIERLAGDYLAALRELIASCRSADTGGYVPGDFPLAQVDQAELDAAFDQVTFDED